MENTTADMPITIETLEFDTDAGLGHTARIGLIVLQTDQTIEYEFAHMFHVPDVALYHARIPNAMEVSPETLRRMQLALPQTAALLPEAFQFDAIGYACTSGATMIGETKVDKIIREVHPQAATSNPLTACKAAFEKLKLRNIALVTPYSPDVTLEMQANLRSSGFNTVAVASFNQTDDFTVARITSESILKAVTNIGARNEVDGVFVSCTSLRTLSIVTQAEVRLGKPVITSNQALGWHLARLCGLSDAKHGFGRIFAS